MPENQNKKILVFIAHGSRDEDAVRATEKFVFEYAERSVFPARLGYIELSSPFIGDVLLEAAENYDEITVVPLILFRSGHAKNDVSLLVGDLRIRFPEKKFTVCDVIGSHPLIAELNYIRACETGLFEQVPENKTIISFIGRGSSDPDANAELFRQSRLFSEGRTFANVLSGFEGITNPGVEEVLGAASLQRPGGIAIVPHFLFDGRLLKRMRNRVKVFMDQYPWIRWAMAEPLGSHENVFQVIDQRILEAEEGSSTLQCDSCRYRTSLPSQGEHVGGLKALLWSIRHSFTHNQAMPHEHAHLVMRKHILVCGNIDCSSRGSIKTLAVIRSELKKRNLLKQIAVTKTSCMGHCGDGPTLVIYPDGIWYRNVNPEDALEIVDEHIVNDRLVARLVDNIM